MSRLAQLERQVSSLKPDELREFRTWFAEYDANRWTDQIRADAESGKLDDLVHAALNDYRAGRADEM